MTRTNREIILLFCISLGFAASTVQRPVLYPNEHLKRAGSASAEQSIDDCMRRAAEYVSSGGQGMDVAESVAIGAGTGSAIGAADDTAARERVQNNASFRTISPYVFADDIPGLPAPELVPDVHWRVSEWRDLAI